MSEDPAIRSRRGFIDRFAAACADDDRVAAVFLSGSYAAGNPDSFSDVDLIVVPAKDAYSGFFEDRWVLMRRFGELVLAEDFNGFGRDMLLYLYADGVDGEVDLHRREKVSWADPSTLVTLVDKDDVLRDVTAWEAPLAAYRRHRIERLFNHFWRQVWLGSGALARGRFFTAHYYLEAVRVCCLNLARLRHDPSSPWSLGGYDKADDVLSPAERSGLERTFVPLEARALATSLTDLVDFFEPLAAELSAENDLAQPEGLAQVVKQRLDGLP